MHLAARKFRFKYAEMSMEDKVLQTIDFLNEFANMLQDLSAKNDSWMMDQIEERLKAHGIYESMSFRWDRGVATHAANAAKTTAENLEKAFDSLKHLSDDVRFDRKEDMKKVERLFANAKKYLAAYLDLLNDHGYHLGDDFPEEVQEETKGLLTKMTPPEEVDEREYIPEVIARFPAEFGLKAFPGKKFSISQSASYFSRPGDPKTLNLYTQVWSEKTNSWEAFAKGSEEELKQNITPL